MITRDEALQMAREAATSKYTNRHYPESPMYTFSPDAAERLVQAAYRRGLEDAADVCEDQRGNWSVEGVGQVALENAASAIRALGSKQ